jgi:transcriptional regulator with XRE-family HTH domain
VNSSEDLGQVLRRLRLEAGFTLRGLAATVGASAAHLSDLEHNRRRPSDVLLRRISRALGKPRVTFEALYHLAPGMDADLREWVASTPGVRKLLRILKESGRDPLEILPAIEKVIARGVSGRKRQGKSEITIKGPAKAGPRRSAR